MPQIRPISDLRNNFTDISTFVNETKEPIFLTKNGHGNMVVMSIETYEKMQAQNDIYGKLLEAELEAKSTSLRYSHEEVFSSLKQSLQEKISNDV